jgi:hypothetical protein
LPCRPDCPGIVVESAAPAGDPRWAPLAALLKEIS